MDTAIGISSKLNGSGLRVVASNATPVKAGATWAVTLTVSGGDASATAASAAVGCTGKGGTTQLRVVSHVVLSVRGGNLTGLCLFRVPKTLKGKKLHASITVSLAGLSTSKAFTATAK